MHREREYSASPTRRHHNLPPITGCDKINLEHTNMNTLKTILRAALAALMMSGIGAQASIIIPDGVPTGITQTYTVSGLGSSISSLTLTLNLSGGNNGDLYAYLSFGGQIVTLINRPGVTSGNLLGYTDPGFNVTLSDGSYANINTYGGNGGNQVTGTYNAVGGATSFGTAFNTLNPNGTWTLFIADLSGGDLSNSQLVSWNLNITAVPEPVNVAMGIFGVLLGAIALARHHAAKRRSVAPKHP